MKADARSTLAVFGSVLLAAVALPITAGAQSGCDAPYPPAGLDTFDSTALIIFTPINGPPINIELEGPVVIERGPEQFDGEFFIETEIVSMELTGFDPGVGVINMRVQDANSQCNDPPQQSMGEVRGTATTRFPATSFFNVFVEIHLPDLGLFGCNVEPFTVHNGNVNCLPPPGSYFSGPVTVPIFGPGGVIIGHVEHAEHGPAVGACCDPTTGICLDGVLAVQCPPPLEYYEDECCCEVACGPIPTEPTTWGEIKSSYDDGAPEDESAAPRE